MTGQELYNRLKNIRLGGQKINFSSLAERLEMSPQNLNKRWKSKEIGTDFINKVANALSITVSQLEQTEINEESTLNEPSTNYNSMNHKYQMLMEEHTALLKEYNNRLKQEIAILEQLAECRQQNAVLMQKVPEAVKGKA